MSQNHVLHFSANRAITDYLVITSTASLSLTDSFTLAFWFRYNKKILLSNQRIDFENAQILNAGTFTETPLGGLQVGFTDQDLDRSLTAKMVLKTDPNQAPWEKLKATSSQEHRSIIPHEWVHIAYVYDKGQDKLRTYFDGRLSQDQVLTDRVKPIDLAGLEIGKPDCVWIHKNPGCTGSLAFDIDDLAFYSRTLTDIEVTQVYSGHQNLMNLPFADSLVAYWPFEGLTPDDHYVDLKQSLMLVLAPGSSPQAVSNPIPLENVPTLEYEPPVNSGEAYAYYPYTPDEKTLFEYIVALANCVPPGSDRHSRSQPLTCVPTNTLAISFIPTDFNALADQISQDLGPYGGYQMATAFGLFLTNTVAVDSWLFGQFYSPNEQPVASIKGDVPGIWRDPVRPSLLSLMATFYTLPANWNPYGPGSGGNAPSRQAIRDRLALSAIVDLLDTLEIFMHKGHYPDSIYAPGYRLSLSAYICQKVCPDLPADVAGAWYRTLLRGLDYTFAQSHGYSLPDADMKTYHGNTGDLQTDLDMLGLQFVIHMVPLAEQYGTPEDRQDVRAIRDEWTRLLVDKKTRQDAMYLEYYKYGETKGMLTSGMCLMEGSLVASYQGTCENLLAEMYLAAWANPQDRVYAGRPADSLRRATELAYYLSLIDERFVGDRAYTSDKSMIARHGKSNPWPLRGLRLQHFMLDNLDAQYNRYLWPEIWHADLLGHIQGGTTFEEMLQSSLSALKRMIPSTLSSKPMTTTYLLRPAKHGYLTWNDWWLANTAEYMRKATVTRVSRTLSSEPSLILYSSQMPSPTLMMKSFGNPHEEDFYVIRQRDLATGLGYYTTLFTGIGLDSIYKGPGGSGIGAFAVTAPRPVTSTMPGLQMAVPVRGGYLGRSGKEEPNKGPADEGTKTRWGRCVLPGESYYIGPQVISDTHRVFPSQVVTDVTRSACSFLARPGRYDWREWPVSAVWAVTRSVLNDEWVDGTTIYGSAYYNPVTPTVSTPVGGYPEIVTRTPISFTFGYESAQDETHWWAPLGCNANASAGGGCVQRHYTFHPSGLIVETRVTNAGDHRYLDNSSTVVLESLPVSFGFQYEPEYGGDRKAAPEQDKLQNHFLHIVRFQGIDDNSLTPSPSGEVRRVARILIYQPKEGVVFGNIQPITDGLPGVEIQFLDTNQNLTTTTVYTTQMPMFDFVQGRNATRVWSLNQNLLFEIPRSHDGSFILTYKLSPYRPDTECRRLIGDLDCDCVVDNADIQDIADHWRGSGPQFDLNGDSHVDLQDIMRVVVHWGDLCPWRRR